MATQLQIPSGNLSLLSKVAQAIPVDRQQPILNLVQQIEDQLTQLEQVILSNAKSLQTDP